MKNITLTVPDEIYLLARVQHQAGYLRLRPRPAIPRISDEHPRGV